MTPTTPHTAAKRPPARARACGIRYRTCFQRLLSENLPSLLTATEIEAELAPLRDGLGKLPKGRTWGAVQLRGEVRLAIDILKRRHFRNTGKEIGRAEIVNAMFLAGLEGITGREGPFAA